MKKYFTIHRFMSESDTRVLFFFPAGFTPIWPYKYIFRALNKRGISVVAFNFKWRSAVREINLHGFRAIFEAVDKEVTSILESKATARYGVFGSSFGSVLCLYIAKRHTEIKTIVLNVPHATVSKIIWTHRPTRHLKKTLVSLGYTEESLHAALGNLETRHGLSLISDRQIHILTAEADTIVPDGLLLEQALLNVNPSTIVRRSKHGHFIGGAQGIANHEEWSSLI